MSSQHSGEHKGGSSDCTRSIDDATIRLTWSSVSFEQQGRKAVDDRDCWPPLWAIAHSIMIAMMSNTLGGGLLCAHQPQQLRRHRTIPCRATSTPVREVLEGGSSSFGGDVPAGLNKVSGKITQPKSQGGSQAMLYATGLVEADLHKPQVRACMPGCADGSGDGSC